jgi:hypothetical protein
MSVAPVDEPQGIWQRLVRALDAYFVDRTKREVPGIILRRSRHEVARCRMLMLKLPQFRSKQAAAAVV